MTSDQFDATCASLSVKIMKIAQVVLTQHGYDGFLSLDDAPCTFHDLVQTHQMRPYGSKFPVYSGGSDQTVYDCPEANYAFRAWHDMLHIQLDAQFSRLGEMACAIAHCSHPDLIDAERKILWVDVMGQFEYEQRHGHFPVDQRSFVKNVLVS